MRVSGRRLFNPLALLVLVYGTSALAATPAHFWSLHAGSGTNDRTVAVAVVPGTGDIVAAGNFHDSIDLGSGPLVTSGPSDQNIWVAGFTKRGALRWVRNFGSTGVEQVNDAAVDASGNVYLTGTLQGADFGGGQIFANGQSDLYLVKLDANGKHVWSHGYGGSDIEGALGLALDNSNHVWLTGAFQGTTQLGGVSGIPSTGMLDVFIARYGTADGLYQGHWVGTGANIGVGQSISTDVSGNVYVAGYFFSDINFAPGPALTSAGGADIFLIKMANNGVPQWSQRRGGVQGEAPNRIATDTSGNVIITGYFDQTTNLGGSDLTATNGSIDILLAKYNSSGVHQWSNRFGGSGEDWGTALSVISSGSIFVAGYCDAGTNFGGGVMPNFGAKDIFVAKFGSNGLNAWSRTMGGGEDDAALCMALDASSNPVIGGRYQGFMNLGGSDMRNAGGEDLFLAKFGIAEPAITSIKDVGNDQGRSVRIALSRSTMDDGSAANPITEYQAFRRVLPLPAALMHGAQPVAAGTWEFVSSVPANNSGAYRMIAPTLADSTIALGMYRTKFFVRAATGDPSIFFDSPVDSGYSLDNLAPGIPANFAYDAGTLSWDKSSATDFDYFAVYGSSTNSFVAATLIKYAIVPTLDVSADIYNYYWVTATDFSGNEGKPAQVNPASGISDGPNPHILSVSAYPNPFNPETTIRYTVPARGHVRIDIFDLAGQRVATLMNREHAAGSFTVAWRGRNDAGENVSSGVYFARLNTAAGDRTYKLVLLK